MIIVMPWPGGSLEESRHGKKHRRILKFLCGNQTKLMNIEEKDSNFLKTALEFPQVIANLKI